MNIDISPQEVPDSEREEDVARAPFALHALELGPVHCLISLDFWLLFFICAVGAPARFSAIFTLQHGLVTEAMHGRKPP